MPYGYSDTEWSSLSTTEKKIVTIVVKYGVNEHSLVRKYLAWPLEEPFNEKTYISVYSRLRKKVAAMTEKRATIPS